MHLPPSPSRGPGRGSALVPALIVAVVLAALTASMLKICYSYNREEGSRKDEALAQEIAEAGLVEGMVAMRTGGPGSIGSPAEPAFFAGGLFWVESEVLTLTRRALLAVGMKDSGRCALEAVVLRQGDTPFKYALFAENDILIKSASIIDSFDSTLGTYADAVLATGTGHGEDAAIVKSNGDIQVANSADVYGDALPGPGGDILGSYQNVTGSTDVATSPVTMPPPDVPVLPAAPAIAVPNHTTVTVPGGDMNVPSITVGTGGTLVIVGPARVELDDFFIDSNSTVVLDATLGKIELYVAGDLAMDSNAQFSTPSQSALGVELNLIGGPLQVVDFDSNAEFYGTIYGHEATVNFASNFEVFGAVAAETVNLPANFALHYDQALQAQTTGTLDVTLESWRIVALPETAYPQKRTDPFGLLGVLAADLPSPADSHD